MRSVFNVSTCIAIGLLSYSLHATTDVDLRVAQHIEDINEALRFAPEDTLIATDIDNTMMLPRQWLGSEAWFDAEVRHAQASSGSRQEAIDKARRKYIKIHQVSQAIPVEEQTPALISELQRAGYRTLGLTARSPLLAGRTHKQLADVGIDFRSTAIYPDSVVTKLEKASGYYQGIMFVTENDKGEALFTLLDKIHQTYKHVIFIDDRLENVEKVLAACHLRGIAATGFYYQAARERMSQYEPELADIQEVVFEHTGLLITDEQARFALAEKG